ncbi:MAG: ABC-F family ATP-binding cassette domain-containing protein [Anaerolineales bacterium]|jgi:ATP-binding cassette subfamily F protein 3
MSLIQANDLSKSYGAQDVLTGVSLTVPRQARIALIGPNGVGKSTLLHLLAGMEQPDDGSLQRARGLDIGFLPQESSYAARTHSGETVWELCQGAFSDLLQREQRLRELEQAMADPRQVDEAMLQYGMAQETFELAGGYTYEARIRQVLGGLGFTAQEMGSPLSRLSGGEMTRALLARLLLEDPDLLILDEPTNHLDLEAIEWLEGWLRDFSGAAVIVSHDRYFLDRVVDQVWELSPNGIVHYRGDYSAYLEQRSQRLALLEANFQAQQEHIRKEQDFIQRNIAGQNTRQAQGRRKRLERMLRDNAIVLPEATRTAQIRFAEATRSGDIVLQTSDLEIGYADADAALFRVPDLTLLRGECVALIGPNGAGKTTFLKTLLGEINPYHGEVSLGASLQCGYFEQAHAGLRPGKTLLEEVLDTDPTLRISEARSLLGRFAFSGDEVEKMVRVLSGGERGRLALLKLVLQGANLLLLDEPTNHLDIPSQETLQAALEAFNGTILLVSHDRYLIRALASQIWVVTPDEGQLEVHLGGYDAYEDARRQARQEAAAHEVGRRTSQQPKPLQKSGKVDLDALEANITALELQLTQVSEAIEQAGSDLEQVMRLGERYAALQETLESKLQQWERAAHGEESA